MRTADQEQLARALGVDISGDSFDVAAARLMDVIAGSVGHEPAEPASERQKKFAESLGCGVAGDTKRVASAKIGEALLARNRQAIVSLNLKPGDRVIRTVQFEYEGELHTMENEFVISSIQDSGRVFFKGGNGQGAWPTQLKPIAG